MRLERYVDLIGKKDEVAVAQFKKQFSRLVRERSIEAATALGLERAALEACMADGATTAELDRQAATFKRTELEGLPSTYVSNFVVQGADEARLRAALGASLSGGGRSARWMFALLVGLFLVTVAGTSRAAQAAGAGEAKRGRGMPRGTPG
jgi:hypothetical protein